MLVSSPCNSTALLNSSRTCNNPHHGVAPDRNQVTIVGVDLPAFLLSKNFSFRVHRNAPAVAETCLVGLTRSAFFSSGFVSTNPEPQAISPSSSAFLVPLFQLRVCKYKPRTPKKSPENKKPGVERRAQSLFPSDSARSSTSSSPCCS